MGARYFVCFSDDASRLVSAYMMAQKRDTLPKFVLLQGMAEAHTVQRICALRSDNGAEYVSAAFLAHLYSHSIRDELTVLSIPQQNRVAERFNRTVMAPCLAMMLRETSPKRFWSVALSRAVYTRIRVTSRSLSPHTYPFQLWHGNHPNLSHLRTFGSTLWYPLPPSTLSTLNPRSSSAILLGYSRHQRIQTLGCGYIKGRNRVNRVFP